MTREAEIIIKQLYECSRREYPSRTDDRIIVAALVYIIKRLEDIPNKTHHLTNPEG